MIPKQVLLPLAERAPPLGTTGDITGAVLRATPHTIFTVRVHR